MAIMENNISQIVGELAFDIVMTFMEEQQNKYN